jgi:hypothetical protein
MVWVVLKHWEIDACFILVVFNVQRLAYLKEA